MSASICRWICLNLVKLEYSCFAVNYHAKFNLIWFYFISFLLFYFNLFHSILSHFIIFRLFSFISFNSPPVSLRLNPHQYRPGNHLRHQVIIVLHMRFSVITLLCHNFDSILHPLYSFSYPFNKIALSFNVLPLFFDVLPSPFNSASFTSSPQ